MILVTGGTGTLGRPTVDALRARGESVTVLSRRTGSGRVVGNLATGTGVREALAGVSTVVHLATASGPGDAEATRILLDAAEDARISHFVFVSIVGIDEIPLAYYREKVECEALIVRSSVPHTILRATQFHELVESVFAGQRWSPVILAPSVVLQPIAAREVAARVAQIAAGAPSGRVADIAGPQVLTGREVAAAWKRSRDSKRPVIPLRLPGGTFRAFATGAALAAGVPYGAVTFDEHLGG